MTEEKVDHLPPARAPRNEGKTVAAWTTMWVLLAGCFLVTLGFIVPSRPLVWTGAAVVVLALVLGRVLAILGHGKGGAATAKRDQRRFAAGRAH